ncbi:polysaccharide deacetylase family protein [Paenibacillus taiwanensis]|uniref:polysaccharide deacetylase family protein n=1 Tax=Paenibacillus taiwanensis TaxID=401638 RepID=UPI000408C9B2|nr:polysaccharide deacetylase family protein [Paenibacillus taiwanensis]
MLRKVVVVLLCSCLSFSTLEVHAWPSQKSREEYEKQGHIIWEAKTDQPIMALTFDDGPDPTQTIAILNVLKKYGVKSTFFVLGRRVKQHPEIVKKVMADGHEIANHTFSHAYFNAGSTSSFIRQEIERTQLAVYEVTGVKPTLFRPPGGNYNDRIINTAHLLGLKSVMWSWHQDTKDWTHPGVHKICDKVLKNAHNGDIVLFHDYVPGKTQTVQALETILPELQKKGFRLVTVSDLIRQSGNQQKVNQPDNHRAKAKHVVK